MHHSPQSFARQRIFFGHAIGGRLFECCGESAPAKPDQDSVPTSAPLVRLTTRIKPSSRWPTLQLAQLLRCELKEDGCKCMEYEALLLAHVQRTLDGVREELRSQEAAAAHFDDPAFHFAKLKLLSNSLRTFWWVQLQRNEARKLVHTSSIAGPTIIGSQNETS
jgi:hypothetical protein